MFSYDIRLIRTVDSTAQVVSSAPSCTDGQQEVASAKRSSVSPGGMRAVESKRLVIRGRSDPTRKKLSTNTAPGRWESRV
jgi:hypothetical protein